MKNILSSIFMVVVCYTLTSFCSEHIFEDKLKDVGTNNDNKEENSGNATDILLTKICDYGIIFNESQGAFIVHEMAFDEGNPDINGRIERPCQAYDTFCIRKYFAEHSDCKISGRQIPDPFFRPQANFHYPSANMSVTTTVSMYEGLNNARVQEFYINKVTDKLVIAFSFDAVTIRSNNTNLKYYLRGREPIVNRDVGFLVFLQITVTLIIPGLDNLRLDGAEIYTYGENPVLPFVVGPRLGLSTDPEVEAMFTFFSTVGVPVEHLEELSTEGVFYGTNYLQYSICDFGLKVL